MIVCFENTGEQRYTMAGLTVKFGETVRFLAERFELKEQFDTQTGKVSGVKITGEVITLDVPTRKKVEVKR